MGFLNLFSRKTDRDALVRLPSGSFTVDRNGSLVASTLPQSFSESYIRDITAVVLDTFRGAAQAQIPLRELVIQFAALKLTAREMRGGAMIFLTPQQIGKT